MHVYGFWGIPLSAIAGLRTDIPGGRNQSQAKVPRLLVNNFRDTRLFIWLLFRIPGPHHTTSTYLAPLCPTYSDFFSILLTTSHLHIPSPLPSPLFVLFCFLYLI